MKAEIADRAIQDAQLGLLACFQQFDLGIVRSTDIIMQARAHANTLTCLLDVAPPNRVEKVQYLLDRYEAFIASLVN